MEWILLAAAVVAGVLGGPVYGTWKINRITRQEKAESLASLQAGCTRNAELTRYYRERQPMRKCQCAAILGITVEDESCPRISETD